MKGGLAMLGAAGLATLTERADYRAGELGRLVDCMQETFPTVVPALLPGSRAEILVRLKTLDDDPAMADLQPDLGELSSKVEAAVAKADK